MTLRTEIFDVFRGNGYIVTSSWRESAIFDEYAQNWIPGLKRLTTDSFFLCSSLYSNYWTEEDSCFECIAHILCCAKSIEGLSRPAIVRHFLSRQKKAQNQSRIRNRKLLMLIKVDKGKLTQRDKVACECVSSSGNTAHTHKDLFSIHPLAVHLSIHPSNQPVQHARLFFLRFLILSLTDFVAAVGLLLFVHLAFSMMNLSFFC